MESIGIVRRIDKLGRITLAKEDRTVLGINEQDPVVMVREGNEIKIKKYENDCLCIFCSEEIQEDTGIRIGNRHICLNCASKIEEKIAK